MKQQNNQLYDMEPDENAPIAEWTEWAQRLKARAIKLEEDLKKARTDLRKARKDIEEKDKAFRYYKQRIAELENTINNIKSNKHYRVIKFFGSLIGRTRRIFKRISGDL